jgi:hypothetical protein
MRGEAGTDGPQEDVEVSGPRGEVGRGGSEGEAPPGRVEDMRRLIACAGEGWVAGKGEAYARMSRWRVNGST